MENRSWFTSFAVAVLNAYLFAFGADAVVSVADDFLGAIIGSEFLTGIRSQVAQVAVFLSLPLAVLLILAPRLPKLLVLPSLVLVWWAAFGAPPFGLHAFSGLVESGRLSQILSVIQLVLAAEMFIRVRRKHGTWFVRSDALSEHAGLTRHILVSVPFAVGLVAFYLILSIASVPVALEQQTGDYVTFSADGVNIRERRFSKGDRNVTLVGMIHVGNQELYQSLYADFPFGALVLAEGVTDREGRLSGRDISAEQPARSLGLVGQPALKPTLDQNGDPYSQNADLSAPQAFESAIDVKPDVLYADLDVADFSDQTIEFLKGISTVFSAESLMEGVQRYFDFTSRSSPEEIQLVFEDILTKRNEFLMSVFDAQVPTHSDIIIPWGAMHMPDLEDRLRSRGFEVASDEIRPLITYGSILGAVGGSGGPS